MNESCNGICTNLGAIDYRLEAGTAKSVHCKSRSVQWNSTFQCHMTCHENRIRRSYLK